MHSVVACPRCPLPLQLCRPIEIVPREDTALLPNRARDIAHDTVRMLHGEVGLFLVRHELFRSREPRSEPARSRFTATFLSRLSMRVSTRIAGRRADPDCSVIRGNGQTQTSRERRSVAEH